jgi:glycosyltransferase involved in cell wall biosynthesis
VSELRVSVVIPAYNAAGTICRAVDSVLRQTYPASEILIIDDGSPDAVEAVLEAYRDRITLIKKTNGGAASARNLGIDCAAGNLIAFLDADDYWEPQKLARHVDLYERYPDLGLSCSRYFSEPPGGEREEVKRTGNADYDSVRSVTGSTAFEFATKAWTGTVVVRRSVLGAHRFITGLEPAEDRHLWVRLATAAPVYYLSECLATVVLESGSLSRSNVDRDCGNMLRVVRSYRDLLGKTATRWWVSHTYYRWSACDADPHSAVVRLICSWIYWPFPYRRADVVMPLARPKLLLMTMRRIIQQQIARIGLRKNSTATASHLT